MLGTFRHLMLYVSDIDRSKTFYSAVLEFLDYTLAHGSATYAMWVPKQGGCAFGISQAPETLREERRERGSPGFHHLAFNADHRDRIDQLYKQVLLPIGAVVLDPPTECPEYSPTYYACYFADPDGHKLEVAHS